MSNKGRSKEAIERNYKKRLAFKQQRKKDAVAYKGGSCKMCGGVFPPCAFDFHHTNPLIKSGTSSRLMNWSWEKLVTELDSCELLCANCHRTVHSSS